MIKLQDLNRYGDQLKSMQETIDLFKNGKITNHSVVEEIVRLIKNFAVFQKDVLIMNESIYLNDFLEED